MTDSTTEVKSDPTGNAPKDASALDTDNAGAPSEAPTTAFPIAAGKRYQRLRVLLAASEWVTIVLLLLALAQFGWSVEIRSFAERRTGHPWLVILIYLIPVGAILVLASMTFSAIRTFMLDRRFAISTQRAPLWLADEIKGIIVGGVLTLLAVETFYALIRRFPDTWWLWAGATFSLLVIVFARLAPVLVFPIFFKFTPITDEEVTGRLSRLAQLTGTRVKAILEFNLSRKTRAANAALAGLGKTRRIILADTLLNNFSLDEIEIVLAHEFGHHKFGHIPKMIAIQTASLFFFFACLGWILGSPEEPLWPSWGFRGSTDVANFPVVLLVIMVLGVATLPITNGLLRRFERQADDFALKATSRPQAFCSAFRRIAQLNLADISPNPVVEFVFHSHPSIGRRIARAEAFLGENGAGKGSNQTGTSDKSHETKSSQ